MLMNLLQNTNYLAALVAAIAYFAVGAVWYSPMLFASKMAYLYTFLAEFVIAIALACVVQLVSGLPTVMLGIKIGLACGVGFAFTTMLVNASFAQRARALLLIDAGYHLVGFMIAGAIVSMWR
jgi:hypothetical protein